ncbi:virulence protein RhuM/Fic/DOC family protein [Endozoicomonas arenosclerae]|uniref:virulence protein RhuM/Fic/DOC family protein n=1 Tax=Endozoicomonas arenosclerae TaxID=1633495 RepID=UPI0007815B54|nr:virulence protein RhuM/Fic/DOC family protein [Endozoicomonas arenosclerae]
MPGQPDQNEIQIFASENGEISVQLSQETIWLTQRQMGQLFDTTPENILMHLKNIFHEQELEENSTSKDFLVVQTEGKRQVRRNLKHYDLDAIISVGYRVNSKRAVLFRQWATRIINDHLTRGYTINQQRFEQNALELEAALKLVRKAASSPELNSSTGRGLVEIVSRYTQTFLWLQRYDEGLLNKPSGQQGGTLPTEQEAEASLAELKQNLIERGEATDLFAKPRGDGLGALLGNLDQTAFGEPAYPTIESKAAHLLYFMVKNHPFTDGNKRSGAFLFVDFLHRNGRLLNDTGEPVINDTGLAALTLLVAESDPKQKETLIRLVMNMLAAEPN